MAIIAQLSDIHLAAGRDGRVDDGSGPVRALRAAVSSLLSLPARPDAVVLTGDLADGGRPAEYERPPRPPSSTPSTWRASGSSAATPRWTGTPTGT